MLTKTEKEGDFHFNGCQKRGRLKNNFPCAQLYASFDASSTPFAVFALPEIVLYFLVFFNETAAAYSSKLLQCTALAAADETEKNICQYASCKWTVNREKKWGKASNFSQSFWTCSKIEKRKSLLTKKKKSKRKNIKTTKFVNWNVDSTVGGGLVLLLMPLNFAVDAAAIAVFRGGGQLSTWKNR